MPYVGNLEDIPKGWFLCNGENNTPDLRNRFLESYGKNEIKNFIEAALPNLKGTYGNSMDGIGKGTGVFYNSTESGQLQTGGYDYSYGGPTINFDASRYSSVYKDSCDTVQPLAFTVYYIIRLK